MTIDLKHLKVLLIDDEAFTRTTIRQIFGMLGVPSGNVYEANSCVTGMAETLRIRPTLVLCDIHMPEADGFKYVAELRGSNIGDVATTPVIMLTSDARKVAVVTAKKMHVDGYIVKPVSAATVKQAIETALKVTLP